VLVGAFPRPNNLLDNAILSGGAVRVPSEVQHHAVEKEKKDDSQDQREHQMADSERGRLSFWLPVFHDGDCEIKVIGY
jgi:hypothetical protein